MSADGYVVCDNWNGWRYGLFARLVLRARVIHCRINTVCNVLTDCSSYLHLRYNGCGVHAQSIIRCITAMVSTSKAQGTRNSNVMLDFELVGGEVGSLGLSLLIAVGNAKKLAYLVTCRKSLAVAHLFDVNIVLGID